MEEDRTLTEELNNARIEASTELDFKCSRCGGMFPTEGEDQSKCPFCGFDCADGTCRILTGSKEDF